MSAFGLDVNVCILVPAINDAVIRFLDDGGEDSTEVFGFLGHPESMTLNCDLLYPSSN